MQEVYIDLSKPLNNEEKNYLYLLIKQEMIDKEEIKIKKRYGRKNPSIENSIIIPEKNRQVKISLSHSLMGLEDPDGTMTYRAVDKEIGRGTYKVVSDYLPYYFSIADNVLVSHKTDPSKGNIPLVRLRLLKPTVQAKDKWIATLINELTITNKINPNSMGQIDIRTNNKCDDKAYVSAIKFSDLTLKEFLRKPLPFQDQIEMIAYITFELDKMHKSGIVHRDIKPENILYNALEKKIKFIDFGSSFYNDGSYVPFFPSSYLHAAPETSNQTEKYDVFSFGVMVLEILDVKLINIFNKTKNAANSFNIKNPDPKNYIVSSDKASDFIKAFDNQFNPPPEFVYSKRLIRFILGGIFEGNPNVRLGSADVSDFFRNLLNLISKPKEKRVIERIADINNLMEKIAGLSREVDDEGYGKLQKLVITLVDVEKSIGEIEEELIEISNKHVMQETDIDMLSPDENVNADKLLLYQKAHEKILDIEEILKNKSEAKNSPNIIEKAIVIITDYKKIYKKSGSLASEAAIKTLVDLSECLSVNQTGGYKLTLFSNNHDADNNKCQEIKKEIDSWLSDNKLVQTDYGSKSVSTLVK